MIRLTVPSIDEDDLRRVEEVLVSGMLVQGPRVAEFENAVAEYLGVKHAVAVSNCTAALHLSLLALGVGPGDLVVVTAYSFIATANVIELCGAQPVFVDICSDTYNIDPSRLEAVLERLMSSHETASRVKAILPVHAFGHVADMPSIMRMAYRHHLPVVEDAACALGASLDGQLAGTWGVVGCFSFHPRKAITTGEGGMIVTDDGVLARTLRALRNHGQDPDAAETSFVLPGYNYRMTDFQAALGLGQITKLDRIIAARHRLAAQYSSMLQDSLVQAPRAISGSKPVYQSYVVLLPEAAAKRRSQIIARLRKEEGIETGIGTWHMPRTEYFSRRYGYGEGDYPTTDWVFDRSLTLPMYEGMSDHEQRKVVAALLTCLDQECGGW